MDIKIEKKKYLVPRKYWAWIGGGAVLIAVLIWLGLSNFSSTLKVDRKGLSIGTVEKAQFNDYVSVDGQVVPISVVQISSEEGGIVLEKVVDEGAHVNKGDVIVKLSNSNLDLEILNAESELAEKQDILLHGFQIIAHLIHLRTAELCILLQSLSDSRKMPSVVPTSTMADTSSRLMVAWWFLGVNIFVISSESSTNG